MLLEKADQEKQIIPKQLVGVGQDKHILHERTSSQSIY